MTNSVSTLGLIATAVLLTACGGSDTTTFSTPAAPASPATAAYLPAPG